MKDINKELFSITTTQTGYSYYYDAIQQMVSPLDTTFKYILDHYLDQGEIDITKVKDDSYLVAPYQPYNYL